MNDERDLSPLFLEGTAFSSLGYLIHLNVTYFPDQVKESLPMVLLALETDLRVLDLKKNHANKLVEFTCIC